MLLMGACGICYEFALGVLGNNLIGSSHEQMLVIIGIMMFAMGLGAALQKRIERDLIDAFLLVELALGVLGGASTLVIYTTYVYTSSHLVVMYGFALAIGAAIGLEIPLLIRINARYSSSLPVNLADILGMDYVGSLIGALLFTYILLSRLSLGRIAIVVGLVNTLLALGGAIYLRRLVRRKRTIVAAAVVWMVILMLALPHTDAWTARLEQRCFADPIVHSETTRYQHLVMTRRKQDLRLYINGHLQFSSTDEAVYHELIVHVPMAVARSRRRVLILGGGDGLALRDVLRYPGVHEVTLVDIDPAMIRLAKQHPALVRLNRGSLLDRRVKTSIANVAPGAQTTVRKKSRLHRALLDDTDYALARVQVMTVDADVFIRGDHGLYDVVIIDLPDPKSVELAKLYSVDFYRALARRLAPGARLAVQSTSPKRARLVFLCIGKTLRAAGFSILPYQDHLVSFGDWGWHLAWRDATPVAEIRARLSSLPRIEVETSYLTPQRLWAALAFGKNALRPHPGLLANTKLRPVLVDYYRRGFD